MPLCVFARVLNKLNIHAVEWTAIAEFSPFSEVSDCFSLCLAFMRSQFSELSKKNTHAFKIFGFEQKKNTLPLIVNIYELVVKE